MSTLVDIARMSGYGDIVTGRRIRTPQRLGAAIRDARRATGLTQVQLAAKAGVSRAWLIDLEAGAGERAELGKVLATVGALGLCLELSPVDDDATDAEAAALDYLAKL